MCKKSRTSQWWFALFAGIFKVAFSHKKLGISKEILATKVLPFLFPLSIENSLTPTQHTSVMSLIKASGMLLCSTSQGVCKKDHRLNDDAWCCTEAWCYHSISLSVGSNHLFFLPLGFINIYNYNWFNIIYHTGNDRESGAGTPN